MIEQKIRQVCIGQIALDDIVIWNQIPKYNCIGGSALFSSLGMALWGEKVGMVGCVGCDYNLLELANLLPESIDTSKIIVRGNRSRRLWVLHDENAQHYFVTKYNSMSEAESAPKITEIPNEYIEYALIFHIAPFPLVQQKEIVSYLHKHNKIITLDPDFNSSSKTSYLSDFEQIFKKIDVFLPSTIEFDKLINNNTHKQGTDFYKRELLKFAEFYNIKYTVLKMAESGVLLYDKYNKHIEEYKAINVNVVDCTGAGDAFAGGFSYAYKFSKNPYQAVKYGLISASYAIQGIELAGLLEANRSMQKANDRYSQFF